MDAFVVRSAQLFARDTALLVKLSQRQEAAARRALESHGARVVVGEPAPHERVTLLVGEPVDEATRRRHPRAAAVTPQWVSDCARAQTRLPTDALEPPAKKRRALDHEQPLEDGASPRAGTVGSQARATPDLSRPWKTVNSGALFALDARATDYQRDDAPPARVAAFDLDGTLIVTKSGKRFAQNADDWKLLDATRVSATLQRLAREGYALAILSNQNGVAKGKTSVVDVQRKLTAVVKKLNVPMVVLFATQDDEMRKPRTGAWRWLLGELGIDPATADLSESLYCGDAAGRPKIAGRNKDFAATDYEFALNAGVQFHTPEALFLDSTQRVHTRPEMWEIDFDPRSLPTADATTSRLDPPTSSLTSEKQELVVLVGPPASGKSHLAKQFTDYQVVCQDELKTVAKCVAASEAALDAGKSVVVDSTNRDPRSRKDWIALAQKRNVAVRCFFMDVAKPLSMHLNTFRKLTSSKEIPDIAIHTFFKNYVAPKEEEGFDGVVRVRFCVEPESLSPEHRRLIVSFL